jgi:hypothetical protein
MVVQAHLMSVARRYCIEAHYFPGLFTHLTFCDHEPPLQLSGIANVSGMAIAGTVDL